MIVVAATGSAKSEDFGGLGGLAGGAGAGAIGTYSNTPQGKVVVASFVDAYNNLVKAVRNYKAQHIAGGPGTGGSLQVQQ